MSRVFSVSASMAVHPLARRVSGHAPCIQPRTLHATHPQGVLIDMLAELSGDVEHSCGTGAALQQVGQPACCLRFALLRLPGTWSCPCFPCFVAIAVGKSLSGSA